MRTITLVLTFAIAAASAAAERYAGRTLADVLRMLESKGLRIVYSESVVPPHLVVASEPKSTQPRAILDEVLEPHSLRADAGPRGTLLIVRVEEDPQPNAIMPTAVAEIVVTPSRFELLEAEPGSRQFLSREEVQSVPHIGDDLYRAIARVPGAATSEVTARPNIRGGAEDEVAVLIDGAEVYDPFHLRDLFRAFSTIDADAIGGADVMTGGFPAEYGGRMSGVIDVTTLTPSDTLTELGIGLLNARAMSRGRFGNQRGEWLLSVRRGYLREVLEIVDDTSEIDPAYYDLLGKLQWTLRPDAIVSVQALMSSDRLKVDEEGERATARYDDRYFWVNARAAPSPRLYVESVLSTASLRLLRDGSYGGGGFNSTGAARDERNGRIATLKTGASFDVDGSNVLKAGVTLRDVRAQYDYAAVATTESAPLVGGAPPRDLAREATVNVSGNEIAAYAAHRLRAGPRVAIESGLRVESETFTPDGVSVSPRLNVAWLLRRGTTLRAAWGRFSQPQTIFELPVEDGVTAFDPAQRAVHRIIGLDQLIAPGLDVRFEIYDKQFTNLRARYENIFDRIVLFPELRYDRVRVDADEARAKGAELLLRWQRGAHPLSGWLSLSRSEVTDRIDGGDVARAWDQRDAVTFSVNYRHGDVWNFNFAGSYHSGWPTTPVTARLVDGVVVAEAGERNSERLPAYRRVDFRASRSVSTGRGAVSFFVELFNVFDHENVVRVNGFEYDVREEGVEVKPRRESIFGVIPSFGVTWRF